MKFIVDLEDILVCLECVIEIIKIELNDVCIKFGDVWCIELLVGEVLSFEDEDLIEEEEVVIILINNGYIKWMVNFEFWV